VPSHRPLETCLELWAVPRAVPCARQHTRWALGEWNLDRVRDSAELVVSELITNAVQASCHTGENLPVRLRLAAEVTHLSIRVWDCSPRPPRPADAADTDEAGRGLLIVDILSTCWDWYPHEGGKVVRAKLSLEHALD
jgi:anti-sigma regulatory factor (Ser/Thr protein kinase)